MKKVHSGRVWRMRGERVRRRLAAILVAGFSRLFPGDEKDNFAGLRAFLTEVIDPLIPEFERKHLQAHRRSGADRVRQRRRSDALRRRPARRGGANNQTLPNEQRLAMRIGINLGDIIAEGGDIFGDGVNIAARVEALAEPGSIFVSEMAYHHRSPTRSISISRISARRRLKNIRRPIRVYRMGGEIKEQSADLDDAAPAVAASRAGVRRSARDRGVAVRQFQRRPGAGVLR